MGGALFDSTNVGLIEDERLPTIIERGKEKMLNKRGVQTVDGLNKLQPFTGIFQLFGKYFAIMQ